MNNCAAVLSRQWVRLGFSLALTLVFGLFHPAPAQAAEPWQDALPTATTIGSGEARWLGVRLYKATLWAPQRPVDLTQSFALELHYYITVSKQRLVKTSIEEIVRMDGGIPAETVARWKVLLGDAFVDVASGDELIGIYLPMRGMRFYNRDRLLAEIDDLALAKAFFSIWLGPATRDAGLRKQLLGESP